MKLTLQILKELGRNSTLLSCITLLVSVTYLVIWCKHERQKIAAIPHLVFSRVHQLLAISGLHTKIHRCVASAKVSQMDAVWNIWGNISQPSSKEKRYHMELIIP